MQFGAFMDKYLKAKDLGQTVYFGQAWPTLDAGGLLNLWAPGNNYAFWDDKEFGDMLTEASTVTAPDKRQQLYAKATKRMCEQAPAIFLFNQPDTYVHTKKVMWKARGDEMIRAYDMKPVQ